MRSMLPLSIVARISKLSPQYNLFLNNLARLHHLAKGFYILELTRTDENGLCPLHATFGEVFVFKACVSSTIFLKFYIFIITLFILPLYYGRKPICLLGFSGGAGGVNNCFMASKTTLNCWSYFLSISSIFFWRSL